MKKAKKLSIFFLVLLFTIFPLRPDSLVQSLHTLAATENISGTVTWSENKIVSDKVVIPNGATLIIKNGLTISFKNNANITAAGGELIIAGTVKDPVKFRAEDDTGKGYSLIATNNGIINMRNSDISDGGMNISQAYEKSILSNRAFASEYKGAIHADNGRLEVQASNFHDNANAISVKNSTALNIRVNRSKFADNLNYNVVSDFYSGNLPNFKYNWWGNVNGPQKICPTCSVYDGISGGIDFSNWLTSENFRDPVIIIPGIMGSWEVNEEWKLDPILHSYENIYNKLDQEGYTPNVDLFEFPYQWRNSNVENAQYLSSAIAAVKTANGGWPKVDLIAHSMGGLLARQYIESDNYTYSNDVDQLITVGTPHKGAPKAYLGWEAGEMGKDFGSYILEKILKREAEKAGYDSLFHYIQNIPKIRDHAMESVRELLPRYNYIFDLDLNTPLIYPTGYPQNGFLENLNSSAKLKNLLKVENDIIYGKVDSENTISAFEVIHAPAFGDYWADGYPKSYNSLLWGEEGVKYGEGDETVPTLSAMGIDADYKIPINASHNHLTTEAQTDIVELLTGNRPGTDSEIRDAGIDIKDILLVQVYCPVDIKVIDQYGKTIGRNINDFASKGAVYINNGDNEEFITIPNPEDLEYRVVAEGTNGGGDYKVEVTRIKEDQISPQLAQVSETILKGTTSPDKITDEKTFELEEGKVLSPDTAPPTITITFPEEKEYLNNQIIPVDYSITDETSSDDKITKTIKYDNHPLEENQIDLSLEHLGGHSFKITATDEAGNSSDQEINFQITTSLDALQSNVNHYFDLGLIKNKCEKKRLLAGTKIIKFLQKSLEEAKNNRRLNAKAKEKLAQAIQKEINRQIGQIEKRLNRRSGRWIDPKAAKLLIESLNTIRS